MTRACLPLSAALFFLATVPVIAGSSESDHRLLAAQEELKIAKEHLRGADTDYAGHRRAAMEHIDRALVELRQAVELSRTEPFQPGHEKKTRPAPAPAPAEDPGED
jgi:hypothetical protein